MKSVLLTASLLISLSAASYASCTEELAKSVGITEQCLGALDTMHARLTATGEGNKDAEIARLNRVIGEKDARIAVLERRAAGKAAAVEEESGLIASLKRTIVGLTGERDTAIAERDAAAAERDALKIENERYKARIARLKKKSNLTTRYAELNNSEVLSEGAYRVAAYLLNVRSEPTANADQVAVFKRGEVVRIFDVSMRVVGGSEIFWAKTRKGWIYVTDSSDEQIRAELVDFMEMKKADRTSRLAGKPGKGGERS